MEHTKRQKQTKIHIKTNTMKNFDGHSPWKKEIALLQLQTCQWIWMAEGLTASVLVNKGIFGCVLRVGEPRCR